MPASHSSPDALLAANARLAALRAQLQQQKQSAGSGREVESAGTAVSRSNASPVALPDHLGWDSPAVGTVLRRQERQKREMAAVPIKQPQIDAATQIQHKTEPLKSAETEIFAASVKVYPDIALGMLRQEQAAAGRVWLLARVLDRAGTGVLRIVNIKNQLTNKQSPMHICGWRQLRNLLRQGEGIFWQRDKERLWLRSAAKTAAALDVAQLTGRPVAVPVPALLGTIGDVRAHLYASFHSGRQKEATPQKRLKPIARATLERLSGVAPASQRLYEQRTQVQAQAHFAVGERSAPHLEETRAWQRGGALFTLADYRGEQGKKGGSYLAWQLPNSYTGPHQQRPRGRQKRINRELKDLVMQGMPGNEQETIAKRYYADGAQAARGYGRIQRKGKAVTEVYWPRKTTRSQHFCIWQVIGVIDAG